MLTKIMICLFLAYFAVLIFVLWKTISGFDPREMEERDD